VEARVRDAMSTCHLLFEEGHPLADALDAIARRGIPATVIDVNGNFKGLLLRRDASHALQQGTSRASLTVGEVCRRPVSVGLDDSLQAALALMDAKRVGYLPVVEGGNPVGGVTRTEVERCAEKHLEPLQRSRARWRRAEPDTELTGGKELSGEAFIAKAESYGAFAIDQTILEIGPGYGRLLRECLRRKLPFRKYVAVDISPLNGKYLIEEFERDDVVVIVGDVETVALNECFDVVLSSLTLKHLYPSFESALRNIERHLNPGATAIFDLPEGDDRHWFSGDEITYIRSYSRAGVEGILSGIPLELVAFDEVEHLPEWVRLLVVARKPLDR
jgi:SAM-dependent methyltransferase